MINRKSRWYVIIEPKLYDLKVRSSILNCFTEKGRSVLFKYSRVGLDDYDPQLRKETIEQNFQGFIGKYIKYHNEDNRYITEEKIKDFLLQSSRYYFTEKSFDMQTKIKEELLDRLYNRKYDEFAPDTLEKVKEIIAKSIEDEERPEIDGFIKSRVVFENKSEISFQSEGLNSQYNNIWYEVVDESEIAKALGIDFFFECIITEDKTNFDDYLFSIELYEHNDYQLVINDTYDLLCELLPKLELIIDVKHSIITLEKFLDNNSDRE